MTAIIPTGEPGEVFHLLEAIRLTQEYAQLPAIPGWSWYDAYRYHRPEDAERLRQEWERHRHFTKQNGRGEA